MKYVTVGRFGSTVARVNGLNIPVWATKVYEARSRRRDGLVSLRLVETTEDTAAGFAPSLAHTQRARTHAADIGAVYLDGARQGMVVE